MLKKVYLGLLALFFVSLSGAEEIKVGEILDVSQYRDIKNYNEKIKDEKIVYLVDEQDSLFTLKKVYLNEINEVIAIMSSSEETLKLKTLEACKIMLNDSHIKNQKKYTFITKLENRFEWGYEYSTALKDKNSFLTSFEFIADRFARNFLSVSKIEEKKQAKLDFVKDFNKNFKEKIDLKNLSCEEQDDKSFVLKTVDIGNMLEYFMIELSEKEKSLSETIVIEKETTVKKT